MNLKAILFILFFTFSSIIHANNQCKSLEFGIVDWTDVRVTTATAQVLLEKLGYRVKIREHSVDGIYKRLADGTLDAFLGNWMPTMDPIIKPYVEQGQINSIQLNLDNAKYTLAVPKYVFEAGVRTFADLAKFKDKFAGRIYGLEKGNDGNQLIQQMIDKNEFGLNGFKLLATSERIMLAQVKKRVREGDWIVFLAWTPHPMNNQFDIRYLAGGDEYFGPNFGGSTVHTNVRANFAKDCPNASRFLKNLTFDVEMEGEVMNQVINEFVPADRAVRDWMYHNPERVSRWLNGVKNLDGETIDPKTITESLKLTFDS